MLIRAAKEGYGTNGSRLEDTLKRCGIKECRRNLLIFVRRDQYDCERAGVPLDPLETLNGLAFLINTSIVDGRGNLSTLYLNNSNSSLIRMNVYAFDVVFDHTFQNVHGAIFTPRSAYGSEIGNDYITHDTRSGDLALFSRLITQSNNPELYGAFTDMFDSCPTLVPPEFYTSEHMYDVENDYYELGQIGPIVYTGSQLIDAYTDIRLLDIRSWDSMRRVLETVYREDVMKANEELAMVSPNMIDACQSIVTTSFDPVASSMITGSTFIYDTADGINIRGGSVPFQQFREKKGVVEDLTHLTEVIRMRCQQMEKEFGEIRVFYSPFTFGDKIKIISKQNHQIISTPNPIGFDRDFTTDAMISDITDVMHQEIVGAEDY